MPDQDVRLQHLNVWLDEQLDTLFENEGWGPVPPATLTAASSDASFRRYFRWAVSYTHLTLPTNREV